MTYPNNTCSNGTTHKNSWPNRDTQKTSEIQNIEPPKNSTSPCSRQKSKYPPLGNKQGLRSRNLTKIAIPMSEQFHLKRRGCYSDRRSCKRDLWRRQKSVIGIPLLFWNSAILCFYVNEQGHEKTCFMLYANNKDADQPAHPLSLFSVFVFRCLDSIIPLLVIAEIPRP